MKTNVLHLTKRSTFFFCVLLICAFTSLHSQTPNLIPTGTSESNFGAAGIYPTCYNREAIVFSGGNKDVFLSAVDGSFNWQLFNAGTTVLFSSGTFLYPNCRDINVGFTYSGSSPRAVVAYYQSSAPVGHYVDVYQWNATGSSCTLLSHTALSTIAAYTRISMDSHIDGPTACWVAIVLEDPDPITGGIQVYSSTAGGAFIGGVLPGTLGLKSPDVAFSHLTRPVLPTLHFVYRSGSGTSYTYYETTALYSVTHTTSPVAPTLEDTNPITSIVTPPIASLDCPDHNTVTVDYWTYVYSNNTSSIFARVYGGGSPLTVDLVSGALGQVALPVTNVEPRPRVAYNHSGASFHVVFFGNYNVGPYTYCYFSEQINSAGTTLISAHDYELVALNSVHPAGANNYQISLSKQNDDSHYLYCVFSVTAGGLHHKRHPWTTTANFRATGINEQNNPESFSTNPLSVGPNPFAEYISLTVPEGLQHENMTAALTDITGKLILNYDGKAGEASALIEQASKGLPNGTYFLNTHIKSAGINQSFKLQSITSGSH